MRAKRAAVIALAAFFAVTSAAPAALADSPAAAGDTTVAAAAEQAFLITIPAKAEVGVSVIRLGDIAAISPVAPAASVQAGPMDDVLGSLEALELSPAALPGQARYLSRMVIEAKLRYAGFEPSSYRLEMPASVTVRTQSQVVSKEKAAALLRPQVVEAVRYPEEAVDFGLTLWPTLTLLPGEVSLSARLGRSRLDLGIQSGLLVFPVEVFLDGVRVTSVTARASLVVKDMVAVTTRDLPRQHVIGPDDVRLVEKPLAGLPADAVRDTAKAIGLRTTKAVKSGLVLNAQELEALPAVAARQSVSIMIQVGAVTVTAQGEALEDGLLGQTIRVQNLESKKIILARVSAPGQVLVTLSPGN